PFCQSQCLTFAAAPIGTTLSEGMLVTNIGGAPTFSLGEATPLSAPFSWSGDGGFPGGSGQGVLGDASYPFCGATLASGATCLLNVTETASGDCSGAMSTIDLAYADSLGPAAPDAGWRVYAAPGEPDGGPCPKWFP